MRRKNGHNEFAVIGLGRFGSSLAMRLVERGYDVLGVDRDRDIVQRMSDQLTRVVALDATDPDALNAVDIPAFDTVVVAIGTNFEANLLATVELKALGVRHVVCKATSERQRTILLRVGADRVVLPEYEAGSRLARELTEPEVIEQLDCGAGYSISEVELPANLVGRSLRDADLRRHARLTVLVVRRDGETIAGPPPEFVFAAGDLVYVLGRNDDIHRFSETR
jgi:trk system potassium uptake protein